MQAEFDVGPTGAQWIVNAYLLPLGAFVLIGGALGDHYGRRRVFTAGLIVFAAACALCAVAWNFPVLLLGRALEGIGAAMLAPTSLAIIADGFSGRERGAAIGTWAAAGRGRRGRGPRPGRRDRGHGGMAMGLRPHRAHRPMRHRHRARRAVRESRADPDETAPLDWARARPCRAPGSWR